MAREDIISMSVKELRSLSIIKKILDKQITQEEGGRMLRLSCRQVRRKVKRVRKEGEHGIIHRLRRIPSNRAHPKKEKILSICRKRYRGFGPTLAVEKLLEIEKISISAETLRGWFIEGVIGYKRRRSRKHRRWRKRKVYVGEMIQVDGSHHDWFEGRGAECVLMGYIDDATGRFFGRFFDYEGTLPAMVSFRTYIRKYGIPQSVYIDKHTTYKSNAKPSIEEQLNAREPLTQVGRALEELGVEVIYAHSPQAKGRIERSFRTHQDRLIKEMRLAGVRNIEEGNRFISSYYGPKHNRKFAIAPQERANLHRPVPAGIELDSILCLKKEAVLRNDFTVAYEKKFYQVLDKTNAKKVIVEERANGRVYIRYKGKKLRYRVIEKRPLQETKAVIPQIKKKRRLSINHPWKARMYQNRLRQEKTREEMVLTRA